ncbi:GGDEF domain-containing protein [Lacrimispora sp.]|uniref:GGDEF domain-containing protein n=1 Tax=Lacrimispora sp. TaxID=2719234 RepID=UPI0032E40B5B
MTEKDAHVLLGQIQSIITNKPVTGQLEGDTPVYKELQDTISCLSGYMLKMNQQVTRSRGFNSLLLAIINSLKDWVVVIEEQTGKILYTNDLVKSRFYNVETGQFICGEECGLMDWLQSPGKIEDKQKFEYQCKQKKFFQVESHWVQWEDTRAVIHLISDVTFQKETEAHLEIMAYKDELTGLNNRRCCISTIDEYMNAEPLFALCMIDLDGLKTINDQFGHLNGDEYLICVSQELKQSANPGDFICRFGGDEFVILYRGITEEEAEKRLAEVNQNLATNPVGYSMSFSYGIVCIKKEMNLLPETAIKIADEKMYQFKRMRK